jgi:hypothetical protein
MGGDIHPPVSSGGKMADKLEAEGSKLESTLARLEALYKKFGRDGLKDFPIADVQLLLYSKQLALEAGTGKGFNDAEANRLLKLEVHDLTYYVKTQIAALQMPMSQLKAQAKQWDNRPRQRDRENER